MRNSLKQLFRKPVKALLFFFLMAAAAMLLVFGASMYGQNVLRTQALEGMFTTVGTVEQPRPPASLGTMEVLWSQENYEDLILPEVLDFPGAGYTVPPENRPFYLADLTGYKQLSDETLTYDLLEFKVLENKGEEPLKAVITQVFQNGTARMEHDITGMEYDEEIRTKPGMEVTLRRNTSSQSLEPGKTYVGYLYDGYASSNYWYSMSTDTKLFEFYSIGAPFTSQVDARGVPVDQGHFPESNGIDLVTEDFYGESGRYQDWTNMLEANQMADLVVPVLPVSNWDLLSCCRNSSLRVRGRTITQEELDAGARVCLVSQDFAKKNLLYEGDTITLPLLASMYGYQDNRYYSFSLPGACSLLDAEGLPYEPFWEAEYEIVGIYTLQYKNKELPFPDMFIIPQKSVEASDQENIIYYGPMNRAAVSFQIPNGTAEAFLAALVEAHPQAEDLNITFDDMGYSRAVDSLDNAKRTAFLLFLVGLLSAAAIIALLLYFFVVLEKKRTAVERSLGMTKRQCRVSLMAGILLLALAASSTGSACAWVVLDRVNAASLAELEEQNTLETDGETFVKDWGLGGIYNFSAQYSPWAMWDIKSNQAALSAVDPPLAIYLAIPLLLCALVALLAALLIGRNLKIEPILLLNGKD